MRNMSPFSIFVALALIAGLTGDARADDGFATPAELGRALFFDPNLSKNRTQACATCHNPAHAFTDPRETEVGRGVPGR